MIFGITIAMACRCHMSPESGNGMGMDGRITQMVFHWCHIWHRWHPKICLIRMALKKKLIRKFIKNKNTLFCKDQWPYKEEGQPHKPEGSPIARTLPLIAVRLTPKCQTAQTPKQKSGWIQKNICIQQWEESSSVKTGWFNNMDTTN